MTNQTTTTKPVVITDDQFDFLTTNNTDLGMSSREISKLNDKKLYALLVKLDKLHIKMAYAKNDAINKAAIKKIEADRLEKIEADRLEKLKVGEYFKDCNLGFHQYGASYVQYKNCVKNAVPTANAQFYAKILELYANGFNKGQITKIVIDHGLQTEIKSGMPNVVILRDYFYDHIDNIDELFNNFKASCKTVPNVIRKPHTRNNVKAKEKTTEMTQADIDKAQTKLNDRAQNEANADKLLNDTLAS